MNKNKILIIGGTSGMGFALAKYYLNQNWAVYIVGHNLEKIHKIQLSNPEIHIIQSDLRSPTQRQELWQNLEKYSPYQAIIYCAGFYLNERRFQLTPEERDTMLAVNLHAFQECFAWATQHLSPFQSQFQSINHINININNTQRPVLACFSSIAGLLDYPYPSLYAQCKRAMIHTAECYRNAFQDSIYILTICLGYVNTETLRNLNQGNAQHKPFIIEENQAILAIIQAIKNQQNTLIYPPAMRYLSYFMNILPKKLLSWIMRKKLDQQIHFLK